MTGFKFPLESALRLRHLQVENETAKLTVLNRQLQELRQSLANTQDDRKQAGAFVQGRQVIASGDLRALASFTLSLEARANSLKESLDKMERRIYDQRLLLRKAKQDERALKKLRDHRLSDWTIRFDRETETTAQELWLYSHTKDKDGAKRR